MSLILDALRRADSERERERGAVPGLHAQQVAVAPEAPAPAGARPWLWLLVAAATGLLAALAAWFVAGRDTPRAVAAPAAVQPPPVALPAAPPPVAPVAAVPAPAASAVEPKPVAEPAPWPSPDSGRKATTVEVGAPPAVRAPEVGAMQSAGGAPAEATIAPREQLPAGIRSQLPPLAVGGSIYSANPPDRSVIIDGRLLRENDRLTADLTLEQIRPKSAVLRFKGYRFEIGF